MTARIIGSWLTSGSRCIVSNEDDGSWVVLVEPLEDEVLLYDGLGGSIRLHVNAIPLLTSKLLEIKKVLE